MFEKGINGADSRYLCLYPDEERNYKEISKFSEADAKVSRFLLFFGSSSSVFALLWNKSLHIYLAMKNLFAVSHGGDRLRMFLRVT